MNLLHPVVCLPFWGVKPSDPAPESAHVEKTTKKSIIANIQTQNCKELFVDKVLVWDPLLAECSRRKTPAPGQTGVTGPGQDQQKV